MEELKLEKGKTYSLKVIDFKPKQKTINKAGRPHDLYYVKLQDATGKTVLCEYAAIAGTCADCFVPGIVQFVKVLFLSPQGTPEIEPTEDPAMSKHNTGGLPTPPDRVVRMPEVDANPYSANISGKSYTFAMAYAKDILVADISRRSFGEEVSDEDISVKLVRWADIINDAMVTRMSF